MLHDLKSVPAPPRIDPVQWRRVAAEQHGVIAFDQLMALGVTKDVIRANVGARRWSRVLPRVYSTVTGPLPRAAALCAALLYAGGHALLSHRTAAQEWRMLDGDDGPVHVTVPYGCSAIDQPGVVVHRSRALPYLGVRTDPPRTSRADTVVDLAVAEPDARAAMRTFLAAATRGRVPVRDLRLRLERRRPRRYRRALHQALALLTDGVLSPLEHRYVTDVEQAHGLPSARRQTPFVVDGRTLWEDATYDHLGIPLTVRLDGRRTHAVPEIAFRDHQRDNAAELAGRHRLVFGWHDVDRRPCGPANDVATVLRRAGWHGPLRACPRCCS